MDKSNLNSNRDSSTKEPDKVPGSVRIARWLFVFLGVIWMVFGTWSIIRIGDSGVNISRTMMVIIAVLIFINSVVLLWIGWGIGKGQKLYYYFGLLALAGNIFLTLTDEFGIFDLFVLIIAVALFFLLILTRSNYLHN